MGLKYNLSEIIDIEKIHELRLELAPRNQCRNYVLENGGKAELVSKPEFDSFYKNRDFIDGPYKDNFGDSYGDPYNPNRQAFGKLKKGDIIYCELSEAFQEKTKKLLEASV